MPDIKLEVIDLTKINYDVMKAMQNFIQNEYFKTLIRSNNKVTKLSAHYHILSNRFCFVFVL